MVPSPEGDLTRCPTSTAYSRSQRPQGLADDPFSLWQFFTTDSCGHAGLQMVLQNQAVHFVQGALHGDRLLDDVDAILAVIHHALYAPYMALDALQAVQYLLLHVLALLYPPRGGEGGVSDDKLYHNNHTNTSAIWGILTLAKWPMSF